MPCGGGGHSGAAEDARHMGAPGTPVLVADLRLELGWWTETASVSATASLWPKLELRGSYTPYRSNSSRLTGHEQMWEYPKVTS